MRSCQFCAAAIAVALTRSILPSGSLVSSQAACCAILVFICQRLILRTALSLEERMQKMSEDVCADRAVMPMAALCIPASAACGFAWMLVNYISVLFGDI